MKKNRRSAIALKRALMMALVTMMLVDPAQAITPIKTRMSSAAFSALKEFGSQALPARMIPFRHRPESHVPWLSRLLPVHSPKMLISAGILAAGVLCFLLPAEKVIDGIFGLSLIGGMARQKRNGREPDSDESRIYDNRDPILKFLEEDEKSGSKRLAEELPDTRLMSVLLWTIHKSHIQTRSELREALLSPKLTTNHQQSSLAHPLSTDQVDRIFDALSQLNRRFLKSTAADRQSVEELKLTNAGPLMNPFRKGKPSVDYPGPTKLARVGHLWLALREPRHTFEVEPANAAGEIQLKMTAGRVLPPKPLHYSLQWGYDEVLQILSVSKISSSQGQATSPAMNALFMAVLLQHSRQWGSKRARWVVFDVTGLPNVICRWVSSWKNVGYCELKPSTEGQRKFLAGPLNWSWLPAAEEMLALFDERDWLTLRIGSKAARTMGKSTASAA